METKSILVFGAGKIGRSFIGQLFGLSGYEVIFADVDLALVDALNQRKSYPVIIKSEQGDHTIQVTNVRAVSSLDRDRLVQEITQASLLCVSVGKNALEKVIPVIADGLVKRCQIDRDASMNIIIAENMRSAADFLFERLADCLPESYPLKQLVGLVETSIGKMVPIMNQSDLEADPLAVFAEPYNDLIVDKMGFKGEIPKVKGLSPKENIKAWVDRKAFIHNLGHAATAYQSSFYHPQYRFIYEALADPNIFSFVRRVMLQAAEILLKVYPNDFSSGDLEEHIDDLLKRFQNKALKDTVFRVGQDLPRKLGIDDRFAGAIQQAGKNGLPYDLILEAMSYGFFFFYNSQSELTNTDRIFLASLEKGIESTLIEFCQFDPQAHHELIMELEEKYLKLNRILLKPT